MIVFLKRKVKHHRVFNGVFMKSLFLIFLFAFFSSQSIAGNIDSSGKYVGKIKSVAIGHWGHVGVQLDNGVVCNGKKVVLLRTDEPLFDAYYSLLLTAQTTSQSVEINRITSSDNHHLGYCTIKYIALGDLSEW